MAKQKVWQFIILLHPSDKDAKKGSKSEIIIPITHILATSQDAAFLAAAQAIPDEHSGNLDNVEIALRPF